MKKRTVLFLLLLLLLIFSVVVFAACSGEPVKDAPLIAEESFATAHWSNENVVENIEQSHVSQDDYDDYEVLGSSVYAFVSDDEALSDSLWVCPILIPTNEPGEYLVNLHSVGIVARSILGYQNGYASFDLEPLPRSHQEFGVLDWSHYADRLSQVNYNLRIHHSLEQEVELIVYRLLVRDQIIHNSFEHDYGQFLRFPPYEYLNTEIFYDFLEENVSIEIMDESVPNFSEISISEQQDWHVYSHVICLQTQTSCWGSIFIVWQIDGLSGSDRTIWDMLTVVELGCAEGDSCMRRLNMLRYAEEHGVGLLDISQYDSSHVQR